MYLFTCCNSEGTINLGEGIGAETYITDFFTFTCYLSLLILILEASSFITLTILISNNPDSLYPHSNHCEGVGAAALEIFE